MFQWIAALILFTVSFICSAFISVQEANQTQGRPSLGVDWNDPNLQQQAQHLESLEADPLGLGKDEENPVELRDIQEFMSTDDQSDQIDQEAQSDQETQRRLAF